MFGQDSLGEEFLLCRSNENFGSLSFCGIRNTSSKLTLLREDGDFVICFLGEVLVVECLELFNFAQIFLLRIFLLLRKEIVSFRLLRKGTSASSKAERNNGERENFGMCYAGE